MVLYGAALVVFGWGLSEATQYLLNKLSQLSSEPQPQLPSHKTSTSVPTASIASDLSKQYGVPLSAVEDMIAKNPGLTRDEYALLVQYYKKYGTYPYGVISIFTGMDQNGKSKIYFVTRGDLKHTRQHSDHLQHLSDEELLQIIQKLLQGEPDLVKIDKQRNLIDYYYNDEEINGKYVTVIIRMSTSTPGRIISIYEEW